MIRRNKCFKLSWVLILPLVVICISYPGLNPAHFYNGVGHAQACDGGGDGDEDCENPQACTCSYMDCECGNGCNNQNPCGVCPPLMVQPYDFNGIFVQGEERTYDLEFEFTGVNTEDLRDSLCNVVITIEEEKDADGNSADVATLLNIYNNREPVDEMIFPRSQILWAMAEASGYYGTQPIAIQANFPLDGPFPCTAQLVATLNNNDQCEYIYPFQIKQHVPIHVGLESYVEQYFVCYDSRLSYDTDSPLKAFIRFTEGEWDNPDLLGYTLGSVNLYVTGDAAKLIKEDGTECEPRPEGARGCWLTYDKDDLENIMSLDNEYSGYYGEFKFSIRGIYPDDGVELYIEVNGPPKNKWQEIVMLTAFPVYSPIEIGGLYNTEDADNWEVWDGMLCACTNEETNTPEEQQACWKTVNVELKFPGVTEEDFPDGNLPYELVDPKNIFVDCDLPCELTFKITDEKDANGQPADDIVVMLYSGDEVKEKSYDKETLAQAMSVANYYWGTVPISFKGNNPGTAKLIAYINGYENNIIYSKMITAVGVEIETLEFTSDHNVIRNGTTLTTAGTRFPDIEWDPNATPSVNAPITHTASSSAKIALTLTLDVSGMPNNTSYTLTGNSTESALLFSKTGTISSGTNVSVPVVATNAIGSTIRKIENKITWSMQIGSTTINLGDTGNHVMYTTLGSPNTSAPSSSSVPNVPRMDISVPTVADAITAAGTTSNYTKIVWEIVKAKGNYTLGVPLNDNEAWRLPSLPNGADCLSISKFVRNVCMSMGIPGQFAAETYAAYYRIAGDLDRPKKAIAGLALNNPYIHPNDKGVPVTPGLDGSWILGLADQNCTKFGGGAPPGTVGCGPGGLNAFEAAVIYTDQANKKWYFPGGTDFIYDNINAIVQIFETMVWVGSGDHDGDPLTPNVLVVKVVDYNTYTLQPDATP